MPVGMAAEKAGTTMNVNKPMYGLFSLWSSENIKRRIITIRLSNAMRKPEIVIQLYAFPGIFIRTGI